MEDDMARKIHTPERIRSVKLDPFQGSRSLLEIYSLTPMDAEAKKSRNYCPAFKREKGARSEGLDRRPKCHGLGGRQLPNGETEGGCLRVRRIPADRYREQTQPEPVH